MRVDVVLIRDGLELNELDLHGEAPVAGRGKAQAAAHRLKGGQRLEGLLTELVGPPRGGNRDGEGVVGELEGTREGRRVRVELHDDRAVVGEIRKRVVSFGAHSYAA